MFGKKEIEEFKKEIAESVPHLSKADAVFGVVADLHLSLKVPLAREDEENWLLKQAGYCRELRLVKEALNIGIGCAGDIFDQWNAPAKLCNFVLDVIPRMYAVPGQHDLPYHSYELIEDSGFANLLKAERIEYLHDFPAIEHHSGKCLHIEGFGWEKELKSPQLDGDLGVAPEDTIKIALVHKYVQRDEETRYQGMDYRTAQKTFCRNITEKLKGFDIAVFGDNHIPFQWQDPNRPLVYNCGSFMRRKANETHRPSIGIIFADKSIHRYYLKSADNDKVNKAPEKETAYDVDAVLGNPELIEALTEMIDSDMPVSFPEAVRHALRNGNVGKHVRQIVLRCLEGK